MMAVSSVKLPPIPWKGKRDNLHFLLPWQKIIIVINVVFTKIVSYLFLIIVVWIVAFSTSYHAFGASLKFFFQRAGALMYLFFFFKWIRFSSHTSVIRF